MDGETRRKKILKYISESNKPVSGTKLGRNFSSEPTGHCAGYCSARVADCAIFSTNRG